MKYFLLLYQAARQWYCSGMGHHAAAFAYYAPFALIPLVLISVGISGFFYGVTFVKNIFIGWGTVFGADLVAFINLAVKNLDTEVNTYKIPLLAILFFCSVSILAFNVLSLGFRQIWGNHHKGFREWLKQSLRSVVMILILQLYIVSIITIEGLLASLDLQTFLLPLAIWFSSISAVFILFYRFLAVGSPSWRGCLVGGLTSGMLFVFAKNLVTLYLAAKPVLTIFGAAGLILVLLVWVYVLAAIIYYGAIVAHLYDKMALTNQ
jgi:membrane protein